MKIRRLSRWSAAALLLLSAAAGVASRALAQDSEAVVIRGLVAAARVPGARWPDFSRYVDDVARLYAAHGGAPIWFGADAGSLAVRAAVAGLAGAAGHGLLPEDYDAVALDSILRAWDRVSPAAGERGRVDVMLSVDLIRYLDDLRRGRTKGAVQSGSVARGGPPDWAAAIDRAREGDSIAELMAHAAPALTQYRNLRLLLERYRGLAVLPASMPLFAERPIVPGQAYGEIAELRRRLALVGDLEGESPASDTMYAGATVEAVRRFQRRHGMEPDGIIGAATLAALNVPLQHRVRQIELALERLRWLPPLGHDPFVVVNIPGFRLFGFDSAGGPGAPSFASRVVVGRALDRETPVLYELLRYVEFRPYWNVPRSILVNEILPRLGRDPGYLRRHRMELVGPADRPLGDQVTSELRRRLARGELRIRQRPGPSNALGLVKFVFPNAANVYMHDTPDSELFERSRRDFSHGCIRVEDAAGLAEWALRDSVNWGSDQVETALAGPGSRRVFLRRPMPVAVVYATAVATPAGEAWFFEDLYGHDRVLDELLRGSPSPP
jgi:murein L,D-transpeptidase YcbB/YkuD